MTGRLEGKVAFITGAARGQGRSHAVRLAEEGAEIIAVDVCADVPNMPYGNATVDDLQETIRLVEKQGRRIVARVADVRDADALDAGLREGVDAFGRLDIVAANAGILTVPQTTTEMSPQAWQDLLDINLTGVWNTARACISHMVAAGRGGAIVITSSVVGLRGAAHVGNYVTAKHGLVGLMRTLALELAPHSIRVNTVHPTQVDTDMIMNEVNFRLFAPDHPNPGRDEFAAVSRATNQLPVPWIEPVDVSNALVFLASDEARYITGVTLPVDAGALLR